jgi:hypothetical protein
MARQRGGAGAQESAADPATGGQPAARGTSQDPRWQQLYQRARNRGAASQ